MLNISNLTWVGLQMIIGKKVWLHQKGIGISHQSLNFGEITGFSINKALAPACFISLK